MGCVVSKKLVGEEEEEDVVLLCRERKLLLKKALESRSALADSQCKYNHSLCAVSAAIRLFASRYSSPSSPFLITFNSSSTNSDQEQKQKQSSKYKEDEEEECEEEESEGQEKEGCECNHFYGPEMGFTPMPCSSPRRDVQWDFFNPFDGVGGFSGEGFDHEDLRVVREKEGIPDLEEDAGERFASGEKGKNVNKNNVVGDLVKGGDGVVGVSQGEQKCLKVVDTPNDGRELLEALKDVVDLFLRGYDSGLDVSRMLETSKVQVESTLEDIKENSNKLVRSITRSRSTSSTLSWSSSCKSLLTSSSKSSSTWTELKNDVFDGYGGMESGSHSLTLGRLYAWEKKLYEEVKSAEETRKIYKQKCSQLRNQEAKRDGLLKCGNKTAVEVKQLYTRTLVSIRSAESIAERIKNLRDLELQPQLIELLHGLMRNWKIMLEMHETQNKIMDQVKSFNCPAYGKFCNDSHRLATLQLEAELQNWHACFAAYVSSQKAYIEALTGWLSKFVITPQTELCGNGINAPPLLAMCHDWLVCLNNLPDKAVTYAMKSFRKDIRALLVKQGEEQQQKRKVDGLAKELDRKVVAFQRAERRVLESKVSGKEGEIHVRSRVEYLTEKKEQLEAFRKRVDMEKVKHQNSMQETQQIAVSGFQAGFSALFESLAEFSQAAVKMYGDQLVTFNENSVANEKIELENLDLKAIKT